MKRQSTARRLMRLLSALAVTLMFLTWNAVCCTDTEDCGIAGTTRCHDGAAEVCLAGGSWLTDDDCREVHMLDGSIEQWECCNANGTAVCMEVCK